MRYLQEPVQCLLVYYVNDLVKNFKEMNIIWRNHLDHCRWQSRSASILRTSIRASQICINRFQIKDLCQDWNKDYLYFKQRFPQLCLQANVTICWVIVFRIRGLSSWSREFWEWSDVGNFPEYSGNHRTQGKGGDIIHHTYWLSWFKSDFVNSKANKVDIGGCYLNLFWCLIISQSYLLVTWLWPCHLSEG